MAAGKFASLPRNMPANHPFPLASSMDLLSSKSPLAERRPDAYPDVSIHGTLPRKKKGPPPVRSCDNFSHMGTLPRPKSPRQVSPLHQGVIQEHPRPDWKDEAFTFSILRRIMSCLSSFWKKPPCQQITWATVKSGGQVV